MKLNNVMIIAGTARNVGKTTFACKIINKYALQYEVVALKITPHSHESGCRLLHKTNDFTISIEENAASGKDSSEMLKAGASKVYYIQAKDEHMPQVLDYLLPLINTGQPIIVESAVLRHHLHPGLFLLLSKGNESDKNQQFIAWADFNITDYTYDVTDFVFDQGIWLK